MLRNHLSAIATFANRVSSARRMQDIGTIVTQEVRRFVGADGASFVLRDDDSCYYIDEDAISPLWRGLKFPMSSCISGWCMRNSKTAILPDIYQDERVPHDVYRPTFVKSMVMVPLGKPDAVGSLGIYWAQPRVFDQYLIEFLEGLAAIAASAITSAHLYAFLVQTEQKLALAHETGSIGSYELDTEICRLKASPTMKQMFGRREGCDFEYRDFIEAFLDSDRGRFVDAIVGALENDKPFALHCRVTMPDLSLRTIRIAGQPSYPNSKTSACIVGAVRLVKAHA